MTAFEQWKQKKSLIEERVNEARTQDLSSVFLIVSDALDELFSSYAISAAVNHENDEWAKELITTGVMRQKQTREMLVWTIMEMPHEKAELANQLLQLAISSPWFSVHDFLEDLSIDGSLLPSQETWNAIFSKTGTVALPQGKEHQGLIEGCNATVRKEGRRISPLFIMAAIKNGFTPPDWMELVVSTISYQGIYPEDEEKAIEFIVSQVLSHAKKPEIENLFGHAIHCGLTNVFLQVLEHIDPLQTTETVERLLTRRTPPLILSILEGSSLKESNFQILATILRKIRSKDPIHDLWASIFSNKCHIYGETFDKTIYLMLKHANPEYTKKFLSNMDEYQSLEAMRLFSNDVSEATILALCEYGFSLDAKKMKEISNLNHGHHMQNSLFNMIYMGSWQAVDRVFLNAMPKHPLRFPGEIASPDNSLLFKYAARDGVNIDKNIIEFLMLQETVSMQRKIMDALVSAYKQWNVTVSRESSIRFMSDFIEKQHRQQQIDASVQKTSPGKPTSF